MIEHTTDLLHKVKFYCVYGKMFFLIESFLRSRFLIYELSKSTSHH